MSDPGPIARLQALVTQPDTMSIIVQRVTDADDPETLREIAKSWKVPLGRLAEWITEDKDRAEQYANALKIAGEMAALDVLQIADDATPEDVAVRKLRIEARKWYAAKLAREKFGEMNEVRHTGSVSLITVLSSLRGREIDVAPEPPALAETSLEKISEKKSEEFTI